MKKLYYVAWYRTERSEKPFLSRAYCGLKYVAGGLKPAPRAVFIRPKESHHD